MATKAKQSKAVQSPIRVGTKVLIRTVTFHALGKIEAIGEREILLSSASWLANDGVLHGELLAKGEFNSNSEIEPIPGIYAIGRGAIVDVCEWAHDLPTEAR
jgi:hypothetical protein